ncbi:MAG: cysteine desulfurase NifS [Firmicutes bacterium]|nr:cysteine desulfurase NifS [Bacillota bacterium]
MVKRVYLDHSATTPVRPEVAELMMTYLTDRFGNPSSLHGFGREAKKGIENARWQVAQVIGAEPEEVIFTSGGTEADNLAIIGTALANQEKGKHIITSSIEHHAVLDACRYLEKQGFQVTYLPVDEMGSVNPAEVAQAIADQTILISIMHANNEVGTIQPIEEIGQIAKEKGIIFHVDAVQTFGKVPVNVNALQVDLLSASAHKIYGPKGTGCLYIRQGTRVEPLLHGGSQEQTQRPGTENTAGIIGFGLAAELASQEMAQNAAHLTQLRERLVKGITGSIEDVKLNGHPVRRVPGHINVSFLHLEGESLLFALDMEGIAASSGSACAAGAIEPSHVLTAIGLPPEVAQASVRMTLGRGNTVEDIDYVLEVLPGIVERLRQTASFSRQAAK